MKLIILIFIISIDQLTKYIINQNLPVNAKYKLLNFLDIVNIHNKGISFGLFSNLLPSLLISFIVFLVILLIIYWYWRSKNNFEKWSLTFLLAGGIGNLIDRMVNQYVVDFIYINYEQYYWPAFNVADISITIGIILLIICAYINYKYRL